MLACPSRLLALAALAAVLAACAGRRGIATEEAIAAKLARVDAIWQSGAPDRHALVEPLLAEVAAQAPDHRGLLWRRARLLAHEGMAAGKDTVALSLYAEAREDGLRCLDQAPRFAEIRRSESWKAAAGALEEPWSHCVLWTAWAWTRWYATQGGNAAALDLPKIIPLVNRAAALDGDGDVVGWMRGVLLVAQPERLGGNPEKGRSLLEKAIQRDGGDLTRRADLVVWVAVPAGDEAMAQEQREVLESSVSDRPEDLGAVARVQAALRADSARERR